MAHSKAPCRHSWNKPNKSRTKNTEDGIINIKVKLFDASKGIGNSKTISMSKMRKITPSKKKRREKGRRALSLGSKPHSKGDLFWRSKDTFLEITVFRNIRSLIIKSPTGKK